MAYSTVYMRLISRRNLKGKHSEYSILYHMKQMAWRLLPDITLALTPQYYGFKEQHNETDKRIASVLVLLFNFLLKFWFKKNCKWLKIFVNKPTKILPLYAKHKKMFGGRRHLLDYLFNLKPIFILRFSIQFLCLPSTKYQNKKSILRKCHRFLNNGSV